MTTDREQYLLERLLRLEAELAIARGIEVAPLLPSVTRGSLYDKEPRDLRQRPVRRIYRRASEDDITVMCSLRRRGKTYADIGRMTRFSASTAAAYTRDVAVEREAA